MNETKPVLIADKTKELSDWCDTIIAESGLSYGAAKQILKKLGGNFESESGESIFGIWIPQVADSIPVQIEIFEPLNEINFSSDTQHVSFRRFQFQMNRSHDFAWAAVGELQAGTAEQTGHFYHFFYHDEQGEKQVLRDPMALSLPFGIFAPAELYNLEEAQSKRTDLHYFKAMAEVDSVEDLPRIPAAKTMVEIHPGTATHERTIAGMSRLFSEIGRKIEQGETLSAFEKNFCAYDGIQLMPVEPIIENPDLPDYWQPEENSDKKQEFSVTLKKPDGFNWGYDVPVFGSVAINPAQLSTGRPDEMIEFLQTLHNFPGRPIKVAIDLVFGHADNQGLELLPADFFTGPNMYGQDLNYRNPVVRAMLVEMLRRKMQFGFDGIRVDGAQDFKYWDDEHQELRHDDDFLTGLSYIPVEIGDTSLYPWMIFEDGRPWPREDWELASTYRHLTEMQPFAYQWSPLIFAHNTPFLFTYWISKWWRMQEVMKHGDKWISGYANHDTVRRGTQVDPSILRVNTTMGESLKEILDFAYNYPATTLLTHAFLPGLPMDFINSSVYAPWSFMRNTDAMYQLKVASEEARFLDWQVTDIEFYDPVHFKNLKELGFASLEALRRFTKALAEYVEITGYNKSAIAHMLNQTTPALEVTEWTEKKLDEFSQAWMNDIYDYCNISHHQKNASEEVSDFNLKARNFRFEHPWLEENFGKNDVLNYVTPANGTVLFYGRRTAPDGSEELLFAANLEGQPKSVTPVDFPVGKIPKDGWERVLTTPGVGAVEADKEFQLKASNGVIFRRI